jgi:hypothetical protein
VPSDGRTYGPGPYLRGVRAAGPLAGNWRAPRLPRVPWFEPTALDLSAPVTFLVGEFADGEVRPAAYDDLPQLYRSFMAAPERFLRHLL